MKSLEPDSECYKILLADSPRNLKAPENIAFENLPVDLRDCFTRVFKDCDPAVEMAKWTN